MIENTVSKVNYTVGTSTVFSFDVPFYQASDIECWLEMSDETSQKLTQGTDYTVEAKTSYENGAKITLVTGTEHVPTLPTGKKLAVMRVLPYTQETNLPDSGKLPSSRMEEQFDKIVCILQQLKEEMDRTLQVPPTREADKETLFEEFVELAEHAGEWAEIAKSSSETAVEASETAVEAKVVAVNASTSAEEAAGSAASARNQVDYLYQTSRAGRATINFGTWGTDSGADISFDTWTPNAPVSEVETHNNSSSAHSGIQGSVSNLTGRMETAESDIDTLETTVGTISGAGYIRGQAYNRFCSTSVIKTKAIKIVGNVYRRDPSNDKTANSLYAWSYSNYTKYTETDDPETNDFAFSPGSYTVKSVGEDTGGKYIVTSYTSWKYKRYSSGDIAATSTCPGFVCWRYNNTYTMYTRRENCAVGDFAYSTLTSSYFELERVQRPAANAWSKAVHGITFESGYPMTAARAKVALMCTSADEGYAMYEYAPWEGDAILTASEVMYYTNSGLTIPSRTRDMLFSPDFTKWTYEFRIWY